MIALWLVVLLIQGGDVVAFAYPSKEDSQEEVVKYAALPDTLALSECFPVNLKRTNVAPKVEL